MIVIILIFGIILGICFIDYLMYFEIKSKNVLKVFLLFD